MRYICIHGHFYQPARENPWSGDVAREDSALPYHDWNERVTAECYAPNARARLMGPGASVVAEVNNYERLSFDFGPTLLGWMERHAPDTYRAVLAADRVGQAHFSGHGQAIAQMYNHTIAPLDSDRDRRTQAVWGIRDFEYRFGRKPEGIWLAETAVDYKTLEILAGLGIRFTILSPHQARAVRLLGHSRWQHVDASSLDSGLPYLVRLESGGSIGVFFYDAAVARDVAFGGLLKDGRVLADRLVAESRTHAPEPRLLLVATDGETYGHHHKFGEMALATCFSKLGSSGVPLTVPAEFLDFCPPRHEVLISENTSWSCPHGVERWRKDCGCSTGGHPNWNQAWRAPLREAMEMLRDRLAEVYECEAGRFFFDPWQARDDYIEVLLDRSRLECFLTNHVRGDGSHFPAVGLLEMQRFMMLALSSDGWFFDDLSELTAIQVIRCACRAIELCRQLCGLDLEPEYLHILGQARSNISEFGTGADIYRRFATRPRT